MLTEKDVKLLATQLELYKDILSQCEKGVLSEELQSTWAEFQSNHLRLVRLGSIDHAYFNQRMFESIKEKFEQVQKSLQKPLIRELVELIGDELPRSQTQDSKIIPHKTIKIDGTQEERPSSAADSLLDLLEVKMQRLDVTIQEAKASLNGKDTDELLRYKDKLQFAWGKIESIVGKVELRYQKDATGAEEVDDLEERVVLLTKELERKISQRKSVAVETPKLPDVKLPQFYGDSKEWAVFFGLFTDLIHKRDDLSDTLKFNYLKGALRGEAKNMIAHLLTGTSNNYSAAWNLLVKRYENKRKLFSDRMEDLLELPQFDGNTEANVKRYLDTINESIFVIKEKGAIPDEANPMFAHIILRKFDQNTVRQYEQHVKKSREIQTLEDVIEFIEQLYNSFSSVQAGKKFQIKENKNATKAYFTEEWNCTYCKNSGHTILRCQKFKTLSADERNSFVRKVKLCNKCLLHSHQTKCMKNWQCQECSLPHNTILHITRKNSNKDKISSNVTQEASKDTLIATALVKVRGLDGNFELLRALIDNASQRTIISEEAAQLLRLPRIKAVTQISGVSSDQIGVAKHKMVIELKPRFRSEFGVNVEAIVLPKLNKSLPNLSFPADKEVWTNSILADPDFNQSSRIDIVIGIDVYPEIMQHGMKKVDGMLGQKTALGWIISGSIKRTCSKKTISATTTVNLAELERFWEMENEVDDEIKKEDQICEEHFKTTTMIDTDGRYIVSIPFKEDKTLGDSRKQAVARFLNLEKKFDTNNLLKQEYVKFINEYRHLGHMVAINDHNKGLYYLPHQAVWRESSSTTKLRVVFDASAKTSNGLSLNDIMYTGPRLQKDIFDIIVKWRSWRYVMSADIEKMYRQIKVTKEDQKYQYIVWRANPTDTLREFKLTTVTYGTASAPFLAVKTLQNTLNDNVCTGKIEEIIKEDFYMDDLITGADTVSECQQIYFSITQHLKKFGFHLRKWLSNNEEIRSIFEEICLNDVVSISDEEAIKTLGLQWDPVNDLFKFRINISTGEYTMRTVLSTIAKIFDPLGWLSPVTLIGKLLIQRLWVEKKKWDQPLDGELLELWSTYLMQLPDLEKVKVPRWIQTNGNHQTELHGFSDASEKAFAAVVYIKVDSSVTLVAAKTKVNPIKNRKTIPKLELCAAHLLAKLMHRIKSSMNRNVSVYAWSDSTITLAWIKNEKHKEKFIRTRVEDIKALMPKMEWRYIRSEENPADVASRGILPNKFFSHALWLQGPSWLSASQKEWPTNQEDTTGTISIAATTMTNNLFASLLDKYSSINKLDRVIAYVLRFIGRMRKCKYPPYLTVKELKTARTEAIKQQQMLDFLREIQTLKNHKELESKSKILPLNPFIDKNGVLRVGGRLQNSNLPYVTKHPIILGKSHLSSLLVQDAHQTTLHGGINVMRIHIQTNYWIIGLKNQLKKHVRSCVTCIRYRQDGVEQLMGNLPESRVTMAYPFLNTGIDYAGPIKMRCSKGRGLKTFKGYIAVFVCMTTKAIHLEAVSDLSSESFLAALRRFFARRGKSSNIYSDNGTNFVGAVRQLDADLEKAIKDTVSVVPTLEKEGIQWHFIPPGAPHFGGIWEAGVKSVKYHLKRVIGDNIFTYEEMSTLLYQIEAVLNSRPLYSTGCEADDIDVLTPGHFLIGRSLIGIPESICAEEIGALDRWKLIQKIRFDFWKKWKEEYLVTLQQRNKWRESKANVQEGQIVLLKNETTHPAKWPIGKITEVHPGTDEKVRVVTVKTRDGTLKRPISKICPLHVEDNIIQPNTSKNRNDPNKMAAFTIMMLMIMQVTNAAFPKADEVSKSYITRLENTSALYLRNMGQVDIITSAWNLVIYYDMSPYFEALEKSDTLLKKMGNICNKLDLFEAQCITALTNMQNRLYYVEENNKLFMNDATARTKRAVLPVMGSFLHILFGVMDDDDRKAMQSNMENLLANQHDLRELAKNQTSIVDSTINILKRTTDEVNSHFTEMHDRIDNITSILKESYLVYRESIKFFMITKQISDMIEEAEKVQTQIIGLLMDVNHGKMNPALLKPTQITDEIRHIKEHLSDKLILPGRANNEIQSIYRQLRAKGLFVDNKLVIQAKIPLLSRQPSHLYELIPMPIKKGVMRVIATITSPYLIYNFELDAYHLISQTTFNQCGRDIPGQYICDGGWPWKDANDGSCEVSALKPDNKDDCAFEEAKASSFWIQLGNNNRWLFNIFDKSSAHIKCPNSHQEMMQLPRQGILNLEAGCTARINGVILVASQNVDSEDFLAIHPYLVKDVNDTVNFMEPLGSITINNTMEIDDLKTHIAQLRKKDVVLRELYFHTISGHISLILVVVVIIVIISYFIGQRALRRRLVTLQFPAVAQNVQN